MSTAVIAQPTYLPWMGFFEQIARADVYVFLDTVQFERQSWQTRNRLKGTRGEPFWLSVPVAAHHLEDPLGSIRIAPREPTWRRKHLRSMEVALEKAPFFREIFPVVREVLERPHELLLELNIDFIRRVCGLLGLAPRLLRASELGVTGAKADLVLAICRALGVDGYYAAEGSRSYLEPALPRFEDAGIAVTFQAWLHPVYPQVGPGFVSHLSVLDALCNLGPGGVRERILPR